MKKRCRRSGTLEGWKRQGARNGRAVPPEGKEKSTRTASVGRDRVLGISGMVGEKSEPYKFCLLFKVVTEETSIRRSSTQLF